MTPEELANAMARHILGINLSAEDEACQECIALAKRAILSERERCAKIAEEHGVGQITVAAQVAAETIAAAIRQGSEGE